MCRTANVAERPSGTGIATMWVCVAKGMSNRDRWEHSYLIVRREILGFVEGELLRKHLPRMFSLI